MRRFMLAGLALGVGACATGPRNIAVRTDGQAMRGNAALEQQYAIDAEICKGDAQKANLSAGTNYYRGIIANISEDIRRDYVITDVAKGCMAGRGYLSVPETEAAETAARLAATQKERQKLSGASKPQAPF